MNPWKEFCGDFAHVLLCVAGAVLIGFTLEYIFGAQSDVRLWHLILGLAGIVACGFVCETYIFGTGEPYIKDSQ